MGGNSKYAVNLLQPSMARRGENCMCPVNIDTPVSSDSNKTGTVTELQQT